MLVTVIIPTFNRAALITRAIRSVLRQTGDTALDVLVVDDGSVDETASVVADVMTHHPEVRYLYQENAGVSAARSAGLQHLLPQTSFVTFLDSDDVLSEGRLDADLPCFTRNPALDLTYARMSIVSQIDNETLLPTPDAQVTNVVGIHLSCAIFRRELVERIGLFNPELRQSEDTDYLLRIFESGSKFQQTDTLAFYYVRHHQNMTLDRKEAGRCFARALLLSVMRRRKDPSLVLDKPSFELKQLQEIEVD